MNSKLTIAFLLAFAVAFSVAQRGGRERGDKGDRGRGNGDGNRRRGPPLIDADDYAWEIDMGSENNTVGQKAFFGNQNNATVVITRGTGVQENGMANSVFLYHPAGLVAFKLLPGRSSNTVEEETGRGRGRRGRFFRSPCFYRITEGNDDTVSELISRNNSNMAFALPVSNVTIDATGEPMRRRDAAALLQEFRPLGRFCRGSRLVQTSDIDPVDAIATATANPDEFDIKNTLNLDNQISVLTLTRPSRAGGRGRGRDLQQK